LDAAAGCRSSPGESANEISIRSINKPSSTPPTYFDLVNPLHVVAQLVQILDVSVANLADDKLRLATARIRTLPGLIPACCCCRGKGVMGMLRVDPLDFKDFDDPELARDGRKKLLAAAAAAGFNIASF
jgi:hypothetical protein